MARLPLFRAITVGLVGLALGTPVKSQVVGNGCSQPNESQSQYLNKLEADARELGGVLRRRGITAYFGPDLEVRGVENHIALEGRAISRDPCVVAEVGSALIRGLEEGGVSATAKHALGLGNIEDNTHFTLGVDNSTLEELMDTTIVPFRQAISDGVDSIMVGHAIYSQIDQSGSPASVSPIIIDGILRNQLGYDGLVVTDATNMAGLSIFYQNEPYHIQRTIDAINAGADVSLVFMDPQVVSNGGITSLVNGVARYIEENPGFEQKARESARRVIENIVKHYGSIANSIVEGGGGLDSYVRNLSARDVAERLIMIEASSPQVVYNVKSRSGLDNSPENVLDIQPEILQTNDGSGVLEQIIGNDNLTSVNLFGSQDGTNRYVVQEFVRNNTLPPLVANDPGLRYTTDRVKPTLEDYGTTFSSLGNPQ